MCRSSMRAGAAPEATFCEWTSTRLTAGEMALQPDPDALRVVVAVQAMAPSTRLPASYTISLDSTE